MQIIGITGNKYHGKDTIGNYLKNNYGYITLSFAQPIKTICRELLSFDDEQLYGNKKETQDNRWFDITPREYYQFIGDLFRNNMRYINADFGDDIFVLSLKQKILSILENNPNQKIVITDVRFVNEYEMIKSLGGSIWRVSRPELVDNDDLHISETELNMLNPDYKLLNNKIDELYKQINDLMSKN